MDRSSGLQTSTPDGPGAADAEASATLYMDAVLSPARSMTARGLATFSVLLGFPILLMAGSFLMTGALPVMGFLGAEALALIIAFSISLRSQHVRTFVQVTADSVRMRHVIPGQKPIEAVLPAYFTKVEVERSRSGAVRVSAAGRAYRIGLFLTLNERLGFAEALQRALKAARSERYSEAGASNEAAALPCL